jgi:hypothetical protein
LPKNDTFPTFQENYPPYLKIFNFLIFFIKIQQSWNVRGFCFMAKEIIQGSF